MFCQSYINRDFFSIFEQKWEERRMLDELRELK